MLELPFLGVDSLELERDVSMAVYQHPATQEDLARWNAKLLMPSPLPQYNVGGIGDAPAGFADFKGMAVCATGGIGAALETAGAVPTSMSATEVRQAMESGVIRAASFAREGGRAGHGRCRFDSHRRQPVQPDRPAPGRGRAGSGAASGARRRRAEAARSHSVGGCNVFATPVPGYVDWIEEFMPLIAFLGISCTQREGGHFRMDMVVGYLRGRVLYAFELVTTLAMLALMTLLVCGSWAHCQRSFDFAAPLWSRDSTMDIGLPIWPAKLLAPVAFAVLTLRHSVRLFGHGRALVTGASQPVGVPLPVDITTQAAREADTVSGNGD